jgi:subfamily B ATP-binding cassette protein MsbA
MKTYLRLLGYIKPYYKIAVPFFLFSLIGTFFNVFQFALLIPLLNFLFTKETAEFAYKHSVAPEFALSKDFFIDYFYYQVHHLKSINPIYALYMMSSIIIFSVIMTNLFGYLSDLQLMKGRTLLVKKLRGAIYEKINYLHLGYFTKEHKGDLLSRMNTDVLEIEAVAGNSIEVVFKQPYLITAYFIALFLISAKLTLFTLLIIPISATGIAFVTKQLKKEAQDAQASVGRILTIIDETLTGMRIIRSFNATSFFIKKLLNNTPLSVK